MIFINHHLFVHFNIFLYLFSIIVVKRDLTSLFTLLFTQYSQYFNTTVVTLSFSCGIFSHVSTVCPRENLLLTFHQTWALLVLAVEQKPQFLVFTIGLF